MMIRTGLVVIAVAALASSANAGQHDAHQAAGTRQPGAEAMQCAQAQPSIAAIVDAANARLESARQSNSPGEMRAAVDHLQRALRDVRAQLAPCAAIRAADPQAGHTMTNAPSAAARTAAPPPATPDPPAGYTMPAPAPVAPPSRAPAADLHAGHTMPAASPAVPKAPAKPSAPAAAKPVANPDPHAGHGGAADAAPSGSSGSSGSSQVPQVLDPVCGLKVDPQSAPVTTHQGRTYYFCSDQHRQLFAKDPATYAPKPRR